LRHLRGQQAVIGSRIGRPLRFARLLQLSTAKRHVKIDEIRKPRHARIGCPVFPCRLFERFSGLREIRTL
jgi:hypothetical protein